MRVGLYLRPRSVHPSGNWSDYERRAPRAVSEDPASTQVNAPGALLAIGVHAIRKSHQVLEPRPRQMLLSPHRPHDGGKCSEVGTFHDERIRLEERK